jgi:hypothetical protein
MEPTPMQRSLARAHHHCYSMQDALALASEFAETQEWEDILVEAKLAMEFMSSLMANCCRLAVEEK